jgi:hypothetical protein
VDRSGNEHRAVTQETVGPPVPASCGAVTEPQKHVAACLLWRFTPPARTRDP